MSKTLPGLAFFHCEEAPESTHPAVSELIGTKPKPVPSSSAMRRAKCVLPMPGSPSSSIGGSSTESSESMHSARCLRTSSSTAVKLGSSSKSRSISGSVEGLTVKRCPPRRSIFSYTERSASFAVGDSSCRAFSTLGTSYTSLKPAMGIVTVEDM